MRGAHRSAALDADLHIFPADVSELLAPGWGRCPVCAGSRLSLFENGRKPSCSLRQNRSIELRESVNPLTRSHGRADGKTPRTCRDVSERNELGNSSADVPVDFGPQYHVLSLRLTSMVRRLWPTRNLSFQLLCVRAYMQAPTSCAGKSQVAFPYCFETNAPT